MDHPTYPLRARVKLLGEVRLAVLADATRWYGKGMSIRDIATLTGRSYGFVHRLLSDGGVELRGRGSRAQTCN